MPNYVKNRVVMEGIADLPLFREVDGKKHFDFNRLIPIPKLDNLRSFFQADRLVEVGSIPNRPAYGARPTRNPIRINMNTAIDGPSALFAPHSITVHEHHLTCFRFFLRWTYQTGLNPALLASL